MKKLWVVAACLGAVAWLVVAMVLGPWLIEAAYMGESFDMLNRAISGQASNSLEDYLVRWRTIQWNLLMLVAAVGILTLPVLLPARAITDQETTPKRVSVVAVVLALALGLFFLGLYHFAPVAYAYVVSEDSWVEYASFASWAMASFLFASVVIRCPGSRRVGTVLLALVCALIAMEEISWGQRILHIPSPQFILEQNRRGELNLHNLVANSNLAILGFVIVWWSIGFRWTVARSTRLERAVAALGVPHPRTGVRPFFLLAAAFMIVHPTFKSPEISEFLLGLAVASLGVVMLHDVTGFGHLRARALATASAVALATTVLVMSFPDPTSVTWTLNVTAERLFLTGNTRQAEAIFDYLEAHPDARWSQTEIYHAQMLIQSGNEGRGRDMLSEMLASRRDSLAERADDSALLRTVGTVLTLMERRQEAIEAFEGALQADSVRLQRPGSPTAEASVRASLGMTHLAMGNCTAAISALASIQRTRANRSIGVGLDRAIHELDCPGASEDWTDFGR